MIQYSAQVCTFLCKVVDWQFWPNFVRAKKSRNLLSSGQGAEKKEREQERQRDKQKEGKEEKNNE